MNDIQKMKDLIQKIKEADVAYFQNDAPIMTDLEYDRLVLDLKILERTTGIHFSDSPIGKVPSDEKEGLKTVTHTKPMLSCNKTKDSNDVVRFAKGHEILLSWKLDGLTLVLRYEGGKFKQAITRGKEGLEGEDVTHTVKLLRNIPLSIPCKETFEVRGEGVVSWDDFNILSRLSKGTSHPRSIASGSVRSISPDVGKLGHIDFFAFELIKDKAPTTKVEHLEFLRKNNFDVVGHILINAESSEEEIKNKLSEMTPEGFAYPVDGIIAEYNDVAYGKSLGATSHHERRMIALKWQDEIKITTFRGVDLITTKTGKNSIVAKFDDVIIDGTRVHRANLHNLTNFEKYQFGIGDKIKVYKANMIVPQIADNVTRSGTYVPPKYCSCCGEALEVRVSPGGIKDLYCPNEDCIARNAHRLARFCDKKALNIEGLSATTLEKLMAYGWIRNYQDIFHLDLHKDDMIARPGFGIDFYNSLQESIEKSRRCYMHQLLVGLGIPLLGSDAARALHQFFYGSFENFEQAVHDNFHFSHIAEISETIENNIYSWFDIPSNRRALKAVLSELTILGADNSSSNKATPLAGAVVVVTGTFENISRSALVDILYALGAKVADRISSETDYLIVGNAPGPKKLSAAIENGIQLVTEKQLPDFIDAK